MKVTLQSVCMALGILSLLSGAVVAQTSTGRLEGRVADESGAILPGATVTATNLATGISRTVTTSSSGGYSIINLQPGSYEVTIILSGFTSQKASPVTVNVDATTTLDGKLKVAAVEEQVTVTGTADTVQIDPKNVTVQSVITERQIDSLPVNGRTFQQLAVLSPQATSGNQSPGSNFDPTKSRVGAISVGGGSGRLINISIDGGDSNDDFVGGQNSQISQEAVQEFNIITSRYNAEHGRASQGIINVITKSGTNRYSGDAFWFFRDKTLNSLSAIEKQLGIEKPDFRRQQFGGVFGGPIKRDRAHFFLSYERQQEDRNGLYNSNGSFPSVDGVIPQPFRQNLYLAKVTGQLTDSINIVARYSQENNQLRNDQGGIAIATPQSVVTLSNDFHTFLAGFTKVGKRFVNEFRFQVSTYDNSIVDPSGNEDAATLQFPSGLFGHNPQSPQFTFETKYQYRDILSIQREKHSLKFGGEYLYQPHFGARVGFGRNTFFYVNDDFDPVTGQVGPTNEVASFTTFSQRLGDATNPPLHYVALFAQDEWSVSDRLTLNLGVRYDVEKNLFVPRDTPTNEVLYPVIGTPKDDYNNVAPRLGFAWDLGGDRHTVVNGGYGLYYEYQAVTSATLYEALNELPRPYEFIFVPPPVPFGPNNIPDFSSTRGFSAGFANSPDLKNPYFHQFSIGVVHQFRPNLLFETGFVGNFGRDALSFTDFNPIVDPITGARRRDDTFPGLGSVQMFVRGARSRYVSWWNDVRYRTGRFNFQASYKLSNAKTNSDSIGGSVADWPLDQINWPDDPTEFGPTLFDERHRVVVSFLADLPARFTLSGIMNAASARPYTPICNGCDVNLDGFTGFFGVGDRVEPRGNRRGDPTFTLDLRVTKFVPLGSERRNLELIFEVFNITNTANFGNNYQKIFDAANFAHPINIATPPRQAQIGVRLNF